MKSVKLLCDQERCPDMCFHLLAETTCEAKQGAEEGFPDKEGAHMFAAASTMMAVAATTISCTDGVFLLMA